MTLPVEYGRIREDTEAECDGTEVFGMLGIWIVVIVVACAIEIATQVQLVSVWAALGGVAAIIADVCGVEKNIQIIVFFAVTFVTLALTRPFAHKLMKQLKKTPTNADRNIGQSGRVTKIVDESAGTFRVVVGGDDWSAVTSDHSLPQIGDDVRVERIEGVKLIVSRI